ncbi:Uncharacterised protein [Klebsiella quasivariicola]|nr:Uncharacterised protein [Klebsiella quasivariicola]
MHSYEDRIRAVELYYRYGKKASVVVMELGYPSTKQLGRWVRIYEEKGDLPRELKPRERYSRTQKIAAAQAQANASARKRGLRPSGSSVTDVEPRVKLHKA